MIKKTITLSEYNAAYEASNAEDTAFYRRSTDIKCEKCEGVYHYEDCRYVLTSFPRKTTVVCNICHDKQFIPVR